MRFAAFTMVASAQSITLAPIASPASGTVSLSATVQGLPQLSYIEYQANRRRLPQSISSSAAAPYSVAWNTADGLWNGQHKVRAVARDSHGVELAASAEQPIQIANGPDTIEVKPSIDFTSPWSGIVSLSIAITRADRQNSYCFLYVDGVYQNNEYGASISCTLTIDTRTLENGQRRIFVQASNVYTNVARGMLEHDVIIVNPAMNFVALEAGASELWLTPGESVQLAPPRLRLADSGTLDVVSSRLAADDFNRPDEPSLSGKWSPVVGAVRLEGTVITGNTPESQLGTSAALWNDRTFPPDQFAESTITRVEVQSWFGLSVRTRPGPQSRALKKPGVRGLPPAYWYGCGTNGSSLNIGRYTPEQSVDLATAAVPVRPGDRIRAEVSGSSPVRIACKLNGAVKVSFEDYSAERILYGSAGVGAYRDTGGTAADNFTAGALDGSRDFPQALYFSSNPAIVAVTHAGLVTAGAIGDADITVFSRGLSRTLRVSVVPRKSPPHFTRDGAIAEIYEPGRSFITRSWFFAGRDNIGSSLAAYKAAANCWEDGAFLTPALGETEAQWRARVDQHWASLRSFHGQSQLCLMATGDDLARTQQALYAATRGPWDPVTYGFEHARNAGFVVGIEMVDEVSAAHGNTPTPVGLGREIRAQGGTCTVIWPGYSINGSQSFVVSDATTPKLNTPVGALWPVSAYIDASRFQFKCPGVEDGSYTATFNVLTSQWFGADYVRNTAFLTLMDRANSVAGRSKIAWPVPAAADSQARVNWAHPKMADYLSIFWAASTRRTPQGQSVNDLIFDMRNAYRAYYADALSQRANPWIMITPAAGPMYKLAGTPHPIGTIDQGAVSFTAPHGLASIMPGNTRMTISNTQGTISGAPDLNGNYYVAGIKNPEALYIAHATSPYSSTGFGGAIRFADGIQYGLYSIQASGSGAVLQINPPDCTLASHLYGRFTVTGTSALELNREWWLAEMPTAYPCTYIQRALPMASGGAQGGTAYFITTNAYIPGVSPLMVIGVSTAATFAGYFYPIIQGAAGVRAYGLSNVDPDADLRARTFFHNEPSLGDGLNYNASPTYTANGMRDRWNAIIPAAQWIAAHEQYLLQPREAAPDYGPEFIATMRSGSAGKLLMIMNTTDGSITRSVDLAAPGISVRYRITERGALMSIVSGAADIVTFAPNEVIAWLSTE